MEKDKYQWSEDTKIAIKVIASELSKRNDFTVTIEQAVEAATKHYVRSVLEIELHDYLIESPPSSVGYQRNEKLNGSIYELDWTQRAINCLQNAGIEKIWQLVEKSEREMLKTKNFGRRNLNEVLNILAELDLNLGMELHPVDKALIADKSMARWMHLKKLNSKGES